MNEWMNEWMKAQQACKWICFRMESVHTLMLKQSTIRLWAKAFMSRVRVECFLGQLKELLIQITLSFRSFLIKKPSFACNKTPSPFQTKQNKTNSGLIDHVSMGSDIVVRLPVVVYPPQVIRVSKLTWCTIQKQKQRLWGPHECRLWTTCNHLRLLVVPPPN